MEASNNITHISIMSCSLEVIYNQSRITGKLTASNLYLLEAINKFLTGCVTSLTEYQKRTLFQLYNNILTSSKEICNVPLQNLNTVVSKPKFIQTGAHPDNTEGIFTSPFNNIFT